MKVRPKFRVVVNFDQFPMEPPLTQLQQKLQETIRSLYQLETMTMQFDPQTQGLYGQEINNLMSKFQQMDDLCPALDGIILPDELVGFIDEGKNPDLYAKQFLQECQEASQTTAAKALALQAFQQELEKELADMQ